MENISAILRSLDYSGVIINVISWALIGIVVIISGYMVFKFRALINNTKDNNPNNIFQTFIYASSEYIICKDSKNSIGDIPDIMYEYRKKLFTTVNPKGLFFWDTRISTYIVITDGDRILVLDREKNKENQLINNIGLDCYGAVQFHNPIGSLLSKLSKNFMLVNFIKLEAIPGISLEQNCKVVYSFKFPFKKEIRNTAVMLGFVVYVSKRDLDKGIDDNNSAIDLTCLSPDDENLTAKTKLAVKHMLHVNSSKKQKKKLTLKLISSKT